MGIDWRIKAFVEQTEWTLNSGPILLSFDLLPSNASVSQPSLCELLSSLLKSGEFSLELLCSEEILENHISEPLSEDHILAVACETEWLQKKSVSLSGLGDFLANLLAGQNPFENAIRNEHNNLPVYNSFYKKQADYDRAKTLSQDFLEALSVPFGSDFCLIDHQAFERQVIVPCIMQVDVRFQFFFWNLGNDSVVLFRNSSKLFIFLTTGTD